MNCMKCGVEIDDGAVFCPRCLADMEKYPVSPGTPIQIPRRPVQEALKKAPARSRTLSPEERLKRLQQVVKWLTLILISALILLGLSISLILEDKGADDRQDAIGQNYNTVGEDKPAE